MSIAFEVLATMSAALFAGAAIYINFVDVAPTPREMASGAPWISRT